MSGVLLAGFAFGGIVRRFDVSLDGGLLKKNATDARLESANGGAGTKLRVFTCTIFRIPPLLPSGPDGGIAGLSPLVRVDLLLLLLHLLHHLFQTLLTTKMRLSHKHANVIVRQAWERQRVSLSTIPIFKAGLERMLTSICGFILCII